jgi:hypothetical protein
MEGSFVSAAEVKFGVRSAGFLAIPISGWQIRQLSTFGWAPNNGDKRVKKEWMMQQVRRVKKGRGREEEEFSFLLAI